MRPLDRTGQVWAVGGLVLLVVGPRQPHGYHPVAVLASEDPAFPPGEATRWPEDGPAGWGAPWSSMRRIA